MSYSLIPFIKPVVSIVVLLAFFAPVSNAFAEDTLSPAGACTWILVMNDKGEVYETEYYCDNPIGIPEQPGSECHDTPDGNSICALPPTTPNQPEKKDEPQVQQSSSSSEEHNSESVQNSSKKGKVKGTIKVNKAKKVSIEKYINALHRIVFGRNPSVSEHAYWMTRIKDKPTISKMLGAMQFHKLHNISH